MTWPNKTVYVVSECEFVLPLMILINDHYKFVVSK